LETSEREWYVKKSPRVQRTKTEKRDHPIEPVPSGLIRRRSLTFLDTGSAGLAAGSTRVLTSCAQGEEQGSKNGDSASTGGKFGGKPTSFQPIEFSDTDELVLPEGFRYEIIRSSGDPLTANQVYGDHNDYVAYFPIDALEGGEDSEESILWVNHEYINTMF
jgi:secreted PhoX family phosphatase